MCPTLDPIEVTPPKEKVVQTFNEKDIEKIVTDGIVNGNIPLPKVEAGTKLYRHTITDDRNELYFISSQRTPFTTILSIIDRFNEGVLWGVFSNENFQNGTVLTLKYDSVEDELVVYYFDYDLSETAISKANIVNHFTDTVTEL